MEQLRGEQLNYDPASQSPAWMTPPPMPAQPWYCDPATDAAGSPTCQTIINRLGPPPGLNTCDLTHVKEVAPGHKIGF